MEKLSLDSLEQVNGGMSGPLFTYKVRGGDTINSICSKYNTTVEEFKSINHCDEVHVGMIVYLPFRG